MAGRLLRHRLALRVAVGALVAAGLAAGLLAHGPTSRQAAPALPTRVLSGRAVTIADLHGHPAALVFWASWCTDCRVEAAAVERFASSAAGHGRVVGIDTTDGGDWRAFLRAHHWSFPVLSDPNGETLASYGVTVGLPATVILDSAGRIASVHYGIETVDSLTTALATTS